MDEIVISEVKTPDGGVGIIFNDVVYRGYELDDIRTFLDHALATGLVRDELTWLDREIDDAVTISSRLQEDATRFDSRGYW